MKCPICKTELLDNARMCSVCKFTRLHVEFSSVYAATNWVETVVLPYRKKWLEEKIIVTQATSTYNTSSTNNYTNNSDKTEPNDFEFTHNEKGVILTKYRNYGFKSHVQIPETICGKPIYYLSPSLFKDCKEITSVYIPNCVQIIGENAFENTSITEIRLPIYLRAIGAEAFKNTPLKSITLPYSLTYIGKETFSNTNITQINFPENIKMIPAGVCSMCSKLTSVTIKGAIDLSAYAFSGCYKLEKLILPETLEIISCDEKNSSYTYLSLTNTSTLILPYSLKKICIDNKPPAKTIVVPNDKIQWESASFGSCDTNDIFNSFFGGFNNRTCRSNDSYTLYCNAGSTTQEFARQHGYSVKPLYSYNK